MKIKKTIRKSIIILILAIFSSSLVHAQSNNLSGEWRCSLENLNFSLIINQQGSKITGYYCVISNYGDKIDCENQNSISGSITNNTVTLRFTSKTYGGYGNAIVQILPNGTIEWVIISQSGNHYVPQNAILKKVIKVKMKANV